MSEVREYIGARYIPLFSDPIEWDSTRSYEPLTVVKHQGSSYVSKQFVPEGIQITDERYWILWADFNAQLEQYRQEVQQFDGRITANANAISAETTAREAADTDLNDYIVTVEGLVQDNFDTLSDRISTEQGARIAADTSLQTAISDEQSARIAADTSLQTAISDEQSARIAADNALDEKIDSVTHGYWGVAGLTDRTDWFLIYSNDGVHFDFKKKINNVTSDGINVYERNGYFYLTDGMRYQKSTDLINWTDKTPLVQNPYVNNGYMWAGFIYDRPDDSIGFLIAAQYKAGTVLNGVGSNAFYFKIDEYTLVQNENGDLNVVGGKETILGGDGSTSYVDPYLVYDENRGYTLAVKNEITTQLEVYNGTTKTTLRNVNINCHIYGLEAPKLQYDSAGNLFIYCHGYNPGTVSYRDSAQNAVLDCNKLENRVYFALLSHVANMVTTGGTYGFHTNLLWDVCKFPATVRHPGFAKCTPKIYQIIANMNSIEGGFLYEEYNLIKNFPNTTQAPTNAVCKIVGKPQGGTAVYNVIGGMSTDLTLQYERAFVNQDRVSIGFLANQTQINNAVLKLGSGFVGGAETPTKKVVTSGEYDGGSIDVILAGIGDAGVARVQSTAL